MIRGIVQDLQARVNVVFRLPGKVEAAFYASVAKICR